MSNLQCIIQMMRARYGTGDLLYFLSRSEKTIRAFSFFNFDELTTIKIPNHIIRIGSAAFACCYNLSKVDIGNQVTVIESQAFSHCYNLLSIDIPYSVSYIGAEAFRSCTRLGVVRLGKSVEYIGNFAFYKCPNVVISAPIGSYAEQYAKSNHLKFIPS